MDNEVLLKRIQKVELNILLCFDNICKQENIKYTLAYGTLIGAIRHGGFIPWDDDIDVIVLREDYDRLMKILPERLPNYYWLQNYETDSDYYQDFAKVRDKRTVYQEKNFENVPVSKCGVWIDIFPYDYCNKGLDVRIRNKLLKYIGLSIYNRTFGINKCSRRNLIPLFVCNFFSLEKLKKYQYRIMVGTKHKKKYVMHISAQLEDGISNYLIPSQWFEPIDWCFEGHILRVPKQYDLILKIMFGDYMQLPSESDRKQHDIINVLIPKGIIVE